MWFFHFRVTHFLAVLVQFCDKEKTLKFSVRKSSLDTSLPIPKKNLVLIYAEDVVSMPQTNERGILAANDVQIAFGAEMYELYLTPSSQKSSADTDGDLAALGWKQTVNGQFPGSRLTISEWLHNNIRRGFVAIQKNCGEYQKVFGDKYNPLFWTGKIAEDKDSNLCEISFAQQKKSKRPYFLYDFNQSGTDSPDDPGSGDCDCAPLIDIIGL